MRSLDTYFVSSERIIGAGEEEGAAGEAAAGGDDRDLGAGDLAIAAVAAQLHDRLVEEAEALGAPGRELPAVGVERQRRRRGRSRVPPSRKSDASPMPQKPSASSHETQLNVKPS